MRRSAETSAALYFLSGSILLIFFIAAVVVGVGEGDTTADFVLGQPNFTSNTSGTSAVGLWTPVGVATDTKGRIYCLEQSNYRVLIWNDLQDSTADIVLGQPSFNTRTADNGGISRYSLDWLQGVNAICTDSTNRLYVSDYNNHRILIFDDLSDTAADRVLGQPNFTSETSYAASANSLSAAGIAVDQAGRIYVCDDNRHRVLIFDGPDTTADTALGQPNFTSSTTNAGGVSSSSLWMPSGIAVDSAGKVYVADKENHRVLIFNNLTDTYADLVLGQPNFTSNTTHYGGISAFSMYGPSDVEVDAAGRIYVADQNRILIFNNLADTKADLVLGQTDFNSVATYNGSGGPVCAYGLASPTGVVVDTTGRVIVADAGNNRILFFNSPPSQMPTTTTTTTTTVPPTSSPTSSSSGGCLIARLHVPDWLIEMCRWCRDIALSSGPIGRLACAFYYLL